MHKTPNFLFVFSLCVCLFFVYRFSEIYSHSLSHIEKRKGFETHGVENDGVNNSFSIACKPSQEKSDILSKDEFSFVTCSSSDFVEQSVNQNAYFSSDCSTFLPKGHSFSSLPLNFSPPLFDTFMFNGEVDVLLIRLNELQNVVTRFVVLESTWSFTKAKKNLLFPQFYHIFSPWFHLIHYVVVDSIPCDLDTTWPTEFFLRNQLYRGVVEAMNSMGMPAAARNSALVAISDVDEIPHELDYFQARTCPGWLAFAPLKLKLNNFVYRLKWKVADWERGSRIAPFVLLRPDSKPATSKVPYTVDELRMIERRPDKGFFSLQTRGWHFGYFMSASAIFRKTRGFSHQELKMPSLEEIENCILVGCWIFGNVSLPVFPFQEKTAAFIESLPKFLKTNLKCFSFYF